MTAFTIGSFFIGKTYINKTIYSLELLDDHEHIKINLLNNKEVVCLINKMYIREIIEINPQTFKFE